MATTLLTVILFITTLFQFNGVSAQVNCSLAENVTDCNTTLSQCFFADGLCQQTKVCFFNMSCQDPSFLAERVMNGDPCYFITQEPTPTSNRECALINPCNSGLNQYQDKPATATSINHCDLIRPKCDYDTQYESAPPTTTTDRVCSPLTDCNGQQITVNATHTSDRQCENFPTHAPTSIPTHLPSQIPTARPSTSLPTGSPTRQPSISPTTQHPTTLTPTDAPTFTHSPSSSPTISPTMPPSTSPTISSTKLSGGNTLKSTTSGATTSGGGGGGVVPPGRRIDEKLSAHNDVGWIILALVLAAILILVIFFCLCRKSDDYSSLKNEHGDMLDSSGGRMTVNDTYEYATNNARLQTNPMYTQVSPDSPSTRYTQEPVYN